MPNTNLHYWKTLNIYLLEIVRTLYLGPQTRTYFPSTQNLAYQQLLLQMVVTRTKQWRFNLWIMYKTSPLKYLNNFFSHYQYSIFIVEILETPYRYKGRVIITHNHITHRQSLLIFLHSSSNFLFPLVCFFLHIVLIISST